MAESCAKAFGRYLRTLRERRGLALDDVASLSKSYADPVAKSYLSRVENGLLSLALPKMIPLCRIYEIPTEALIERLELDLELDKVSAPDTSGLEFSEMLSLGKSAYERGSRWHQYAFFRDSTVVAVRSSLAPQVADRAEQAEYAWIALATASDLLGRHRFALHELLGVQSRGGISPRLTALVLDRMASAQLHLGALDAAERSADAAIDLAVSEDVRDLLGFFYMDRATISRRKGELGNAIRMHQKSFEAFRSADKEIECSRSLHALAVAYFHAARYGAARRAVAASERFAQKYGQARIRGLIHVLQGDLDRIDGLPERAIANWREAARIAKTLNDRELEFHADYSQLRLAREKGDAFQARALTKRLRRNASWIRSEFSELSEFRTTVLNS